MKAKTMKKIVSCVILVVLFCGIAVGVIFGIRSNISNKTVLNRSMSDFNSFSKEVLKMPANYSETGVKERNGKTEVLSSEDGLNSIFGTKRLIIRANGKIDERGAIAHAKGFDNYHILQYRTELEAKNAYTYYTNLKNVEYLAPDIIIKINPEPEESNKIFGYEAGDFDVLRSQGEPSEVPDEDGFLSWGAKTIGVKNYHEYLNSLDSLNEVVVAVIDSGLDVEHGFFENRIADGGRNFLMLPKEGDENYEYWLEQLIRMRNSYGDEFTDRLLNDDSFVHDFIGHGTHVAGTVVDLTLPNVKVLPVSVAMPPTPGTIMPPSTGHSILSSVVLGIEYVSVLQEERGNIAAANMSLSIGKNFMPEDLNDIEFEGITELFKSAVDKLYDSGVVPVAAAGNMGLNTTLFSSPSNLDNAVVVPAIGKEESFLPNEWGVGFADFSSWGETVDIAAPGVNILSAYPNYYGNENDEYLVKIGDDWYAEMSGTSMASPHTAAAVALIKSDSSKELTKEQVVDILYSNAKDNGMLGCDTFYGHGILSVRYASTQKIFEPVNFSRAQEEFADDFQLTISNTRAGSKIFYTLDGKIPNINSSEYAAPITVDKTTIVRAIAYITDEDGKIVEQSEESNIVYKKVIGGVVQDIEDAWETEDVYGGSIIRYKGVLENLVIPEYIGEIRIENIAPGAFFMSGVESVVLPDSVEFIGELAFFGASILKDIYAPNVTEIGEGAFIANTSLKSITDENFPKLEIIGLNTFELCYNLEYVYLSNVSVIDDYVFNFTALKTVVLPSVKAIYGYHVFEQAWGLKDIETTFVFGKDIMHVDKEIIYIPEPTKLEEILIDGEDIIYVHSGFDGFVPYIQINDDRFYNIDGYWYYNGYQEDKYKMDAVWEAEWQRFFDTFGKWVVIDGEDIILDGYLTQVKEETQQYVHLLNSTYLVNGEDVRYIMRSRYPEHIQIDYERYIYINGYWYYNGWQKEEYKMDAGWEAEWQMFLVSYGEWVIVDSELMEVDGYTVKILDENGLYVYFIESHIIDGENVVHILNSGLGFIQIGKDIFVYINGYWYHNGLVDDQYKMDTEWEAEWRVCLEKSGEWVRVNGEIKIVDGHYVTFSNRFIRYLLKTDLTEEDIIWNYSIPSSAIVKGYTGTEAEAVAISNGNTFIPIDLEFKQDLPAELEVVGGMPFIEVEVQGFGLEYQWFENSIASNMDGTRIEGETYNILKLGDSFLDRYFYVVVTDWLGDSITSNVQIIEANMFKVTYGGLNGVSHGNSGTYTYGGGFSLKDPAAREGYTFAGWYDAETEGNKITEISDTATGNIELWARWEEEKGLSTQTIIIIGVAAAVAAALVVAIIIISVKKKRKKI